MHLKKISFNSSSKLQTEWNLKQSCMAFRLDTKHYGEKKIVKSELILTGPCRASCRLSDGQSEILLSILAINDDTLQEKSENYRICDACIIGTLKISVDTVSYEPRFPLPAFPEQLQWSDQGVIHKEMFTNNL